MIIRALKDKRRAVRDDMDYAEWEIGYYHDKQDENSWWEAHGRFMAFSRELSEIDDQIDAAKEGDFSWVTI